VELDRLVAERGEAVRVAGIGAVKRNANDIGGLTQSRDLSRAGGGTAAAPGR
jgi:hypothetical protein